MIKKWFPLTIIFIFAGLPAAFGFPLTHTLSIIYSGNLCGVIEPSG